MRARRECRPWHVLVLLLCLCPLVLCAAVAQAVRRSGTFTLVGTVLYDDGKPVIGKDLDVAEVDSKGGLLFKVGPDGKFRGFPGYGKTDDKGHFRVEVDRTQFEGEKIRFTVRVRLSSGAAPEAVRNKLDVPASFEVDDKLTILDLDKVVGPIVANAK